MATNKQRRALKKQQAKTAEQVVVHRKKGKKEEIPNRDARAVALREWVNDKMKGRAELIAASDYTLPFLTKRLPTGLLTLDRELMGGFPAGGLNQISGPASAGKNYVIACIVRQLQFFLGAKTKVLYALTEMRLDRSQLKRAGARVAYNDDDIIGMDQARQKQGLPPYTPEEIAALKDQVGEIDELHGLAAEDLYDAVLAAVESDVYHLIVIDSFGNIMSAAEQEAESVGDQQRGGAAGVTGKFCRILASLLTMKDEYGRSRSTCVIGLNQVREDMKNPDQFRNPGGRALQHATFVNLWVQSGKFLTTEEKAMAPGGGQRTDYNRWAKEVNWQIKKGKAGIHEGGSGTYLFDFRIDQADFYADTLIAGVEAGIILQNAAWLGIPAPTETSTDPAKIENWLVYENGREKFKQALIDDAMAKAAAGDPNSLMNYIRNKVFLKDGITISYDWED
jgi:RecA/RadA recombinase